MKMKNRPCYREDFEHLFAYDPLTGHLRHKPRSAKDFKGERAHMLAQTWNGRFAGRVAGTVSAHGYITLQINRVPWLAHRVIFALMEGECPVDMDVDHIRGNRADNRWHMIKLATRLENQWNRKLSPANKGRQAGVYPYVGREGTKYRAFLRTNGELKYLGSFDMQEEAVQARETEKAAQAERLGFEYGPVHGM